jgi:hypothetical protein
MPDTTKLHCSTVHVQGTVPQKPERKLHTVLLPDSIPPAIYTLHGSKCLSGDGPRYIYAVIKQSCPTRGLVVYAAVAKGVYETSRCWPILQHNPHHANGPLHVSPKHERCQ